MEERFLEIAGALTDALNDAGVASVSKKAMRADILSPHEFIRHDCEDCEEDLPMFRMQKGLLKCVQCQQKAEKKR